MAAIYKAIAIVFLFSIISCSKGGVNETADKNNNPNPTNNPEIIETKFPNKAGTVFGQWVGENEALKVFIAEGKLLLEAKCDNKTISLEVAAEITSTTIKTLETKKTGTEPCTIEFTKDQVSTYKVTGDILVVTFPSNESLQFTRLVTAKPANPNPQPTTPQQPPAQNEPGGNNNTFQMELYSQANCGGVKSLYLAKMDCNSLAQSQAVLSVKTEGQCQNLSQAVSAVEICESINSQID
jgi:hypothetical protein